MLTKYSKPTKYESAKYGTICQVICGSDEKEMTEYYIQLTKEDQLSVSEGRPELKARWVRLGEFLEDTMAYLFDDEVFLKHCIQLYERPKSLSVISMKQMTDKSPHGLPFEAPKERSRVLKQAMKK